MNYPNECEQCGRPSHDGSCEENRRLVVTGKIHDCLTNRRDTQFTKREIAEKAYEAIESELK